MAPIMNSLATILHTHDLLLLQILRLKSVQHLKFNFEHLPKAPAREL